MRIQSHGASLLLSALLPGLASAVSFKCSEIKTSDHTFDLSGLKGTHEIFHTTANETEGYVTNTTYVLNICDVLHGAANRNGDSCGTSRNVCGFSKWSKDDHSGHGSFPFPIAGLDHVGEGDKDPVATPLKEIDAEKEGLRLKLSGGTYEPSGAVKGKKGPAAAVIDFQCDPDRSGLEGLTVTTDEETKSKRDGEAIKEDSSLQFKSFALDSESETYLLKLDWKTRYACYGYQGGNSDDPSKHWGFFTWMIIILFLGIASYLIFGSWLNYNRYGARGWDLLPHGDTLRDVPYIFQDWVRHVVNSLQGGGSRGGYSAV